MLVAKHFIFVEQQYGCVSIPEDLLSDLPAMSFHNKGALLQEDIPQFLSRPNQAYLLSRQEDRFPPSLASPGGRHIKWCNTKLSMKICAQH